MTLHLPFLAQLRELQANADAAESGSASNGRAGSSTPAAGGEDEADAAMQEPQEDVDARSVYIGNVGSSCREISAVQEESADNNMAFLGFQVDYGSTPEEIQSHFAACGQINRVTILCDKFTGHPKGYVNCTRVGPRSRNGNLSDAYVVPLVQLRVCRVR